MVYDVNAFLISLKSTLVANASTLATSLTVNYPTITSDSIHTTNPINKSIGVDQYPAIILTPTLKTQPPDEIGLSSSTIAREVTLNIDILCLTQAGSDSEDADAQARILSRNVETVLESNLEKNASTTTVNDGWHMALVTNSIYDGAYVESNKTYQSSVKLEVEFKSWGVR